MAAPSAVAITLDKAVETALASNRDLRAAHQSTEIARGQLMQAGLRTNPAVELAGRTTTLIPGQDERTMGGSFEQDFPVTRRLALAKDVSRVDVALALTEIRDRERLLIGRVETQFLDLLLLSRQITLREDAKRVSSEFEALIRKRLALAEVSETDVNQASIEVLRLTQEIERLRVERETGERALRLMLGLEPSDPLDVEGDLDAVLAAFSPDGHEETEAPARPDLRRAQLTEDRAHAEAHLALAEAWADWTVKAGYENEREVLPPPIGVKRDNFLGVSVRIPIPLRNRNQGRIYEQEAIGVQAVKQADALRQTIGAEIATARARAVRLRASAESIKDALTLTDRNVDLVRQGYAEGLASVTQVLLALQQRFDLQGSYLEALKSYAEALVDLETAAGRSRYLAKDFMDPDHDSLTDRALEAK